VDQNNNKIQHAPSICINVLIKKLIKLDDNDYLQLISSTLL